MTPERPFAIHITWTCYGTWFPWRRPRSRFQCLAGRRRLCSKAKHTPNSGPTWERLHAPSREAIAKGANGLSHCRSSLGRRAGLVSGRPGTWLANCPRRRDGQPRACCRDGLSQRCSCGSANPQGREPGCLERSRRSQSALVDCRRQRPLQERLARHRRRGEVRWRPSRKVGRDRRWKSDVQVNERRGLSPPSSLDARRG